MTDDLCREENFKAVFMEQSEGLRNFMFYKTKSYQQAEDIVQEAFSRMWENCAKVVANKAKSYLFTIANNLFLNQVKHQKVVLKFEQRGHTQRTDEDPAFLLLEQEFKERLEKAISDLPEGQRVVFLMNRIDQMKYREIADTLQISVKAVEKRMHKALSALRKISKKV
ncbi:MAG: sigma-70 family RNA polymerase sigma factor [Saprospiraceae bacterium]|jgi:RNA polymerase sigma-70 factor (ECF subfamily)|nr:sigma-70 family RNA polymerase sigma factor [Saprospiraceae bacterium]